MENQNLCDLREFTTAFDIDSDWVGPVLAYTATAVDGTEVYIPMDTSAAWTPLYNELEHEVGPGCEFSPAYLERLADQGIEGSLTLVAHYCEIMEEPGGYLVSLRCYWRLRIPDELPDTLWEQVIWVESLDDLSDYLDGVYEVSHG